MFKKSEILGVHLGDVLTSTSIFQGSKRVSNIKLILKVFWHRFGDDFRGPGNVKNEQERGRVALFLIFGVCKIRCCFGVVLGGPGKGFGEGFWNIVLLFCTFSGKFSGGFCKKKLIKI